MDPHQERQRDTNATTLDDLSETLSDAASQIRQSPEAVSLEALESLINANETLTRVIEILSKDSSSSTHEQALSIYKQPCTELGLEQRMLTILSYAPVVIMRDGLPYGCKKGISTIGELVQIHPQDMLDLRNYGQLTEKHLLERLEASQLQLGTTFSEDQLVELGIDTVRLSPMLYNRGEAVEYKDGSKIKLQEAKALLSTRIVFHPELSDESKDRFRKIEVFSSSLEHRSAETFGDLIQIAVDSSPSNRIPIFLEDALNLLLPHGLCFGMKLSDQQLQALQIERVAFDKYRYR